MNSQASVRLLCLLAFQIFFLRISNAQTKQLLKLEENQTNLAYNCDSGYSAMIRADPFDSTKNCLSFSNMTEGGDTFCGSLTSITGLFEICFDYFGKKLLKDQDSGGFIGLQKVSDKVITWFAGASRLNEVDASIFQYLEDTNSWNHFCVQKSLIKNSPYKLVLQDYKNAGQLIKDAMFKNIVVNEIQVFDEKEQEKQMINGILTSNLINEIELIFQVASESEFSFQLFVPDLKNKYDYLKNLHLGLYLLPSTSDVSSFIEAFNPQYTNPKDNAAYISYEQMIEIDNFKHNNDSAEGYPCNITNNIKICNGILYFYYDNTNININRFTAFEKCQANPIMTYNFQLRVNLSNTNLSSTTDEISQLTQINKIPCYTSECRALVGAGEQVNVNYNITMCKDNSKTCNPIGSNVLLWGQDAFFQFESEPAIKFNVYKAYIYLPDYENSATGLGKELSIDDIVKMRSDYGYLQVRYQVSSQASTIGTSVSLKFLLKQEVSGRMLADQESISYVDLPNIKVLDQNQTINYLVKDEEFEIVWWFWLMIAFFIILIIGNILIYKIIQTIFGNISKDNNNNNPPIQAQRPNDNAQNNLANNNVNNPQIQIEPAQV